MKKNFIVIMVAITACFIGLFFLCYRQTVQSGRFYLRACRTGRLIGPVSLRNGYRLPPLYDRIYIVATPSESELEVRECLLQSRVYETHHVNQDPERVVEEINAMLKSRLGEKAPPVRIELTGESRPPAVTMDFSNDTAAYEAICDLASNALLRVFIEDGAVVLSQKEI